MKDKPLELFLVQRWNDWEVYGSIGALKGALKTSQRWRRREQVSPPGVYPRRYEYFPSESVRLYKTVVGSPEGWIELTDDLIKDGRYSW